MDTITPLIEKATAEFRPAAEEARAAVRGQTVLVDGFLAPCWSWRGVQDLWSGRLAVEHPGHRDRGQATQGGQLLGDADLADPGRDRQADPDRPRGQQRDEDQRGRQLRSVPHGGGHRRAA